MRAERDPRPLLDALPGWRGRAARLKPLAGGLENQTYRVDSRGGTYVLRIAADARGASAEEREIALAVQRQAAAAGLAPRVVAADPAAGVTLSEFLPGRPWTPDMLEDRNRLGQLAGLLRSLHDLPRCGTLFRPEAAVSRHIDILREHGAVPPFAERCRRVIESRPAPRVVACCHNDVVAANVIDGTRPRLIDFDYARDNEPLFDLACLVGWHDLADGQVEYLVDAYGDGASAERRERLATERRAFDALQWLWLAAREASGAPSVPDAAARMRRAAERLAAPTG